MNTGVMEKNIVKKAESQQDDIMADEQKDIIVDKSSSDIEKAIEVYEALPKEQRNILSRGMFAMQQSYSGPLPPAKEFKGYQEVLPDAPERILSMAEKNQEFRMKITEKSEKHEFIRTTIGQIFGFIIALTFGAGSVSLGLEGHDALAAILGGTTVVSLGIIFVLNKLPMFNKEQE